ncbi:VCBS domain-containing protein [Vibrio lentus]
MSATAKSKAFTVTSVDGTEQVVKVTINGTNDAATIAGDQRSWPLKPMRR